MAFQVSLRIYFEMCRCTRWEVFFFCAPAALFRAQRQLQHAAVAEKAVRNPTLCVGLAIERGALYVDVPVLRVEVHVPDRCRVAGNRVGEADLREEGRNKEIYVLAAHGVQTKHGQRRETTHRARVIVARDTADRVVEAAGYVLVHIPGREPRASRMMEDEYEQIRLLVANIEQPRGVVHELQTPQKFFRPAKGRDQGCLVVRNVKCV